tara:strand:+ start:168 stop:602 length:435 start_codon:yes stop_codon:yes gene_type:complete
MSTHINPQTRHKRIPMDERINNFVACAVHCGYAGRDSITRKEVYDICGQTGIVYPRWLAKNPSRRLGRGEYSFPELKAAGSTTITAPDAVSPGHGTNGDDLDDMYIGDDLDADIGIGDDMIDVNDAVVTHSDVLDPNATIHIEG